MFKLNIKKIILTSNKHNLCLSLNLCYMGDSMDKKIHDRLEQIINILIILSLFQIFIQDFFLYLRFSYRIIVLFKIISFYFDLLFTIEFMLKFIDSLKKKDFVSYFFYNNGWADFLASVPLLFFISLPVFCKEILGVNFNLLSDQMFITIESIKFFRVLKLTGKTKNPKSIMTERNITIITTTVAASVIMFFVLISFLQELQILGSPYKKLREKEIEITNNFIGLYKSMPESNFTELLDFQTKNFNNIILLRYKDKIFYNNIYELTSNDITIFIESIVKDKFEIFFTRKDFFSTIAFYRLLNFCLIFFVIFFIVVFYKRFFIESIAKPILTMKKGFEEISFIEAVKIPDKYKEDEIFVMAKNFNLRWLNAKIRKLQELKLKKTGITLINNERGRK